MGVAIPLGYVEDRASGALVVDGSLRFDRSKTHILKNTFSSVGNRKTWTLSFWHKITDTSNPYNIFTASRGSSTRPTFEVAHNYGSSGNLVLSQFNGSGYDIGVKVDGLYRDVGWYHFVVVVDTTQSTDSNRVKAYINGTQRTVTATAGGSVWPSLNTDLEIGNNVLHNISANAFGNNNPMDGYVSNFYYINGQALDPSYFGYTDALTNTWRPKKLSSSVAFGTNGFFLPFDGSAPIGQDQSGRGNNWTPVNFGGSNTLEKATGALPILNTDGGGKVARVGVRTDSYYTNLKLAVPFVGVATDVVQQINGNSAAMSSFTANNATFAVHPTDGAPYGTGLYLNSVSDYPNINYAAGTFNFLHNQTGSGTVEFWMYNGAFSTEASMVMGISGSPDVGFGVQMASSTTLQAIISRGVSGSARNSGTANISQNTWSHIAVTKTINGSNAELKLYVNGVLSASNTSITASDLSNSNSTYSYFRIGQNIGDETARGWTNYYMNDLRIYDTVKYTQNFIPASTDPDILPDTPSGVSYTSNLTQITDGAVAFDGSGDWLNVGTSSDYAFGTGDFTMECFVYHNDLTGQQTYFSDAFGNTAGIYFCKREPANGNVLAIYTTTFIVTGSLALSSRRWHHIAVCRSSGTIRLFVDGVLDGSAADSTNLTQTQYSIGESFDGTSGGMNGFISNAHIIKGTALYTSNFTPPTAPISSVANTKLLCCKSNSSATAFDVSPGTITANGNAAATNFNPFTVNINTQRGQESGYATLNPLANPDGTLSNGNLTWSSTTTQDSACASTIYVNSGKWYWEITDITGTGALNVGISKDNDNLSPTPGTTAGGYYYLASAYKYNNNNISVYGSTWTTGDVISAALNMDAGTVTFYKNGVSQGVAYSGLSGYFSPSIGDGGQSTAASGSINFGQKPFKFPPPAGFQPLALANTPRPTIVRPDQFVGVSTYTGTGAARSINTGFKPDFVWIKERGDTGGHVLYDTVRGATKHLATHSTNAEATDTDALTSFNNNGFSLGSGYTVVSVNGSTRTYVAWAWKAGGNSNTYNINDVGYATASAAGLTAGTITPTGASVNTKSGFSIITYTGGGVDGSVGHGLGVAPKI